MGGGAGESPHEYRTARKVWARALSPRELDVALFVARVLSNKVVARELGLAEGTVKIHLYSVFRKLRAENGHTLILRARSNDE